MFILRTFAAVTAALSVLCAGTVLANTPVQWSASVGGNGHWYAYVPTSYTLWQDAETAARSMTHDGQSGYLATLTTADENAFAYNLFTSQGPSYLAAVWVGGYQTPPATEIDFRADWHWVTGEAWSYTNWYSGEPNNLGGAENALELYNYGNGAFNDCNGTSFGFCGGMVGSIVEFNGVPEPSDWVLTLVGVAVTGLGLRRARRGGSLADSGHACGGQSHRQSSGVKPRFSRQCQRRRTTNVASAIS